METNQIFNYNGTDITFQLGNGNVMVNATEMSKPFNKRPNDYLSLTSTNELIKAVTRKNGIADNQLVRTVKGGSIQGTWLHEDIALDFAQWLSVDFKLWCNDRIKEIVKHGFTATPQKLEEILTNPDLLIGLATELKNERAEKERLAQENALQHAELEKQAPKVLFAQAVEGSQSSCLIGELAKIISQNGTEIGQNRLFQWLRENKYLGTHGEYRNIPMQKYIEQGLFILKKGVRSGNSGELHTTVTPKVTGKGQTYFINKFLNKQSPITL